MTTMRAVWTGGVLAETARTVRAEGNHYFPPESVRRESPPKSVRLWKGLARCRAVTVDGEANPEAAWSYPHPSPLARPIRGHVAFRNGTRVEGPRPGPRDRPPAWLGGTK